jgi:hypothetical protein
MTVRRPVPQIVQANREQTGFGGSRDNAVLKGTRKEGREYG